MNKIQFIKDVLGSSLHDYQLEWLETCPKKVVIYTGRPRIRVVTKELSDDGV